MSTSTYSQDGEDEVNLREHQRRVMEELSKEELIDIIFEAQAEIDRLSTRAGVLLAKLRYIESFCEGAK